MLTGFLAGRAQRQLSPVNLRTCSLRYARSLNVDPLWMCTSRGAGSGAFSCLMRKGPFVHTSLVYRPSCTIVPRSGTVVRLAFDDLVGSPESVVDIGQNQPAHSFSATAVSAAAARVTHGHPYYRADFV